MSKRRPALDDAQLAFSFAAPRPATEEADLAGLEKVIASAVARVLKDDPRSRFEIAGAVSGLLDDDVTKLMLDAYASEARDGHNISAGRFFALLAATGRFDVLDAICGRIGCKVLVGAEIHTAELGHIDRQMAALKVRRSAIEKVAKPINREGHAK